MGGGAASTTLESIPQSTGSPDKILVECYEDPDDFSIRIAGLPGTGLAGVCFGKIIILSAPQKSRLTGYSWSNNLRHELTHTFTLLLSDSRPPRWYTEGLSVCEEWDPNTYSDPILSQKLEQNELVPVEALDLAFHRPKNAGMVALAYAMSGEVVGVLTDALGFPMHLQLLTKFGEGYSTEEILPRVTGLSFNFLNPLVEESIRRRAFLGPPRYTLSAAASSIPQESCASARWVSSSVDTPRDKAWREMVALAKANQWEAVIAKMEVWNASQVSTSSRTISLEMIPFLDAKAVASYRLGNKREARKTAELVLSQFSGEPHPPAPSPKWRGGAFSLATSHCVLGWLERDNRRWDKAVDHFMAAYNYHPRYVTPGSPIREAEEILRQRRNWRKLIEVLETRLYMQPRDVKGFLELAQLHREFGNLEKAHAAVLKAVALEPYLPETQLLWGEMLLDEKRSEQALERFQVASDLDTQSGEARLGIAQALLLSGSGEGAMRAAREALRLDPALEEAAQFLKAQGQ